MTRDQAQRTLNKVTEKFAIIHRRSSKSPLRFFTKYRSDRIDEYNIFTLFIYAQLHRNGSPVTKTETFDNIWVFGELEQMKKIGKRWFAHRRTSESLWCPASWSESKFDKHLSEMIKRLDSIRAERIGDQL